MVIGIMVMVIIITIIIIKSTQVIITKGLQARTSHYIARCANNIILAHAHMVINAIVGMFVGHVRNQVSWAKTIEHHRTITLV